MDKEKELKNIEIVNAYGATYTVGEMMEENAKLKEDRKWLKDEMDKQEKSLKAIAKSYKELQKLHKGTTDRLWEFLMDEKRTGVKDNNKVDEYIKEYKQLHEADFFLSGMASELAEIQWQLNELGVIKELKKNNGK